MAKTTRELLTLLASNSGLDLGVEIEREDQPKIERLRRRGFVNTTTDKVTFPPIIRARISYGGRRLLARGKIAP